ncbi:MAG: PfkB family carbohydrate kinase [Candidatus Helarchaeota archaeon]
MFDLTVIGNLCIDHIKNEIDDKEHLYLGGTSAYAALGASKMGKKVALISPFGSDLSDDLTEILNDRNISIFKIKSDEKQTRFHHITKKNNERKLTLLNKGSIIIDNKIPDDALQTRAVLIGSIIGEVDISVLKKISSYSIPIGLEIQGYVRVVDSKGNISHSFWNEMEEYLKYVRFLKGSINELLAALGVNKPKHLLQILKNVSDMGPEIIIVTKGLQGSTIFKKNISVDIPATRSRCVDRTGAGDTFFSAFMMRFPETDDMINAGYFASAAASFVVEGIGASNFGTLEQILDRMNKQFDLR